MEKIDKEIYKLKKEISKIESDNKKKSEIISLRARLNKLKFQTKHKKLLNVTLGLEQGTKRIFKGLGTTIKKTGQAIQKSDDFIAKEYEKEKSQNKPKKSVFEEAGDID
jgi:hypothetical protein